jgi:hypothetical protein
MCQAAAVDDRQYHRLLDGPGIVRHEWQQRSIPTVADSETNRQTRGQRHLYQRGSEPSCLRSQACVSFSLFFGQRHRSRQYHSLEPSRLHS